MKKMMHANHERCLTMAAVAASRSTLECAGYAASQSIRKSEQVLCKC